MNSRDRFTLAAGLGGFGCAGATVLLLAACLFAALNGPEAGCIPTIGAKATHASYIYEKDDGSVPDGVSIALDKLNREFNLIANPVEQDVKNGNGEIPAQYRVAIPAAQKAGLPALIYHTPEKVLVIVRDPKTEADVLDHKP